MKSRTVTLWVTGMSPCYNACDLGLTNMCVTIPIWEGYLLKQELLCDAGLKNFHLHKNFANIMLFNKSKGSVEKPQVPPCERKSFTMTVWNRVSWRLSLMNSKSHVALWRSVLLHFSLFFHILYTVMDTHEKRLSPSLLHWMNQIIKWMCWAEEKR